MANGGTIEIDVELTGAKDITEEFESIGNAGKNLASAMGNTNEKLGDGIDSIGESLFGLTDSFKEFGGALGDFGKTGKMSFLGLLGPLAGVTTAVFAAYETFTLLSGAAQESEENTAAMAAAAADLESKLEALAENGVKPTSNQLQELSVATLKAQFAKEKLQSHLEKFTKAAVKDHDATLRLEKATEALSKAEKQSTKDMAQLIRARAEFQRATVASTKANIDFRKSIKSLQKEQESVDKGIEKSGKLLKDLEETNKETLQSKIKENAAKLETLVLTELEHKLSEDDFKLKSLQVKEETKLSLIQAEKNKDNREALIKQNDLLNHAISLIDQERIVRRRTMFERKKLLDEMNEKSEAANEKARQASERRRIQAENEVKKIRQEEMKTVAEKARIQQLIIDNQEESEQKQIQLAVLRHTTALKLAKDNHNQTIIANLAFQNELKTIRDTFKLQRETEAKEELQKNKAFAYETAEFNINQMTNEFERENNLLALQYAQRLDAAQGNQEQITELNRRFAIERQNLVSRETDVVNQKLSGFFGNMGRGFAEAAVGAIMFGDSFKQATAQLLQTLAKQAGIESLMEFAKAAAFSITAPPLAAAHLKAGGLFAAAAVAAGGAASVMGAGGGGGGGGGGASVASISPAGTPQTSNMIDREQATEQTLVFNVNFSGAVVYDTKKAAEQALADRVTKIMKQRRRGAPKV